jgi:hypothetical protein
LFLPLRSLFRDSSLFHSVANKTKKKKKARSKDSHYYIEKEECIGKEEKNHSIIFMNKAAL